MRRAVPADGPAFLSLVRDLAEFEDLPPPDDGACERLLRDAFADPPRFELWVGEMEPGRVMAYAVTFMTYSTFLARPTLFLEDIFVHPEARRRGLATTMIEHLLTVARERGCGRCEWMVLDWNHGAKELYRRLGAELQASWQLHRVTFPA